ncbi:MAG TPA: archaeosine biosynthesis radical SAM protein RaSEA [Candidatus Bathyarchaeia archaeon]|nr:archaeosine biosynthesis radical SAM protein RaSEA [Candidatus Bathyarchaeia archaeon]
MNTAKNQNKNPVASWIDYDYFKEERKAIKALTVILRTAGCQWRKCTMCGFWQESADVTQADILAQLDRSLRNSPEEEFILKIFTSGSFLDEREISSATRKEIAAMVRKVGRIRKFIVETRPEFVSAEKIEDLKGVENLELAIGLETANDFFRSKYIKKGFSFDDYRKTAKIIIDGGATVKTYLLLKPPFVSEKKAMEDVIKSAELVSNYSPTISLNLCNIQKYTPLEALWRRGYYRPPWLWSAVEAIKEIKKRNIVVMSDPVGAGFKRGPHNCGTCDLEIKEAIKTFNITQDVRVLEHLDENEIECECKEVWRALLNYDAFLFDSILEGKRLSREKINF